MIAPDQHRAPPPTGWKSIRRAKALRPFRRDATPVENVRSILAAACALLGLGVITIGGFIVTGLDFFYWLIGFPLMLAITGGLLFLSQRLEPKRPDK